MENQANIPVVVGLGEVLWDCFENSRRPGGAPANVAFHARQLGCQGIVCSRVGGDLLGDELLAYLQTHGLDTHWIQRDSDRPTGTVTVDSTEANHPRYVIHEDVAWDFLDCDASTQTLMQRASAVCFGTLAQRNPQSRSAIHECLTQTPPACLRVYDVNLRQHWFAREWIEQSLRLASIVKLNAEEVSVLAELLDLPVEATAFAAEVRSRFGPSLVCITRGGDGCLAVSNSQMVDVPGVKVEVADAVGAGDAFTAGLISTLLKGWPLQRSAQFANRLGGLVASKSGAMPDLREEIELLRNEFD